MNHIDMQTASAPSSSDTAEQRPLRVGIQGYAGAFHELAARRFFGERPLEIVPAHTFDKLVRAIEEGDSTDAGLMAIENTLAGTLLANYLLLTQSRLSITGEVFLHIQQNLLVQPGVRLEDLREVHSHPIAIAQCREFFEDHPHIQLVETADTALSAREVREKGWRQVGAIASTLAAELYELEVLVESIETNKQNHTRFLVLERSKDILFSQGANKVSLSFSVHHEVGSLYKVLAVLAAYNVNLTKIQSAPIIGRPWEYQFFVDFVVDGNVSWEQAIDAISPITRQLKVLGAYPQGAKN